MQNRNHLNLPLYLSRLGLRPHLSGIYSVQVSLNIKLLLWSLVQANSNTSVFAWTLALTRAKKSMILGPLAQAYLKTSLFLGDIVPRYNPITGGKPIIVSMPRARDQDR